MKLNAGLQRALVLGGALCALGCAGERTREKPPDSAARRVSVDDEQVIGMIQAERALKGLPPADLYAERTALETAAMLIRRGGDPETVLRTTLERLAESESTQTIGWAFATNDLEKVPYPSAFVERRELTIGAIVVKMPEAAGGDRPRYVVCFLLVEDGMNDRLGD